MKKILQEDFNLKIIKDLGLQFPTKKSKEKARFAVFECPKCDKHFRTQTRSVLNGHTKSCGCLRLNKLNQEDFNLKIIRDLGMEDGTRFAVFECGNCNGHFKARVVDVRRQHTTSCGCKFNIHGGLSSTHPKLYSRWRGMISRCYDIKDKRFSEYGGRGITVCQEWRESFVKYFNYVSSLGLEEDDYLQVDRRDNDLGYTPENIKLSTRYENCQNTRLINTRNKTGFRGVYKVRGKFRVEIRHKGERYHLGYFDSALSGALAYDAFVRENDTKHPLNLPDGV